MGKNHNEKLLSNEKMPTASRFNSIKKGGNVQIILAASWTSPYLLSHLDMLPS